MSGGVEQHPVGGRERLSSDQRRAKRDRSCDRALQVVDREVQVQLLWDVAVWPRRRRVRLNAIRVDDEVADTDRDHVVGREHDLAVEQAGPERPEHVGIGAVEPDRTNPRDRHVRTIGRRPIRVDSQSSRTRRRRNVWQGDEQQATPLQPPAPPIVQGCHDGLAGVGGRHAHVAMMTAPARRLEPFQQPVP